MFIKRSARKYKGKVYESWHIVESYREGGKIKHKYLLNVTDYTPREREMLKKILAREEVEWIEGLEDFFEEGYDYGDIVFFLYLMKEIGLVDVLREHLGEKALVLLVGVILGRLRESRSKLGTVNWIKETVYPLMSSLTGEEFDENRVYEAMDEFWEKREEIMGSFHRLSGGKPSLLLYDITSVYFEGNKVEKAEYGYSRDHRPDRPQVLLGLCLNEKGFPVYFKLFSGNKKDSSTVGELMDEVRGRFGIRRAVVVGDRGMITTDNLEDIEDIEWGYIMALKHTEAREIISKEKVRPQLFDKKLPFEILNHEKGKRYILCGSPYRKEYDLEVLNRLIERGKKALQSVKKMVETGYIKKKEKVIRRAQKKLTESKAERYFDFRYARNNFKIIQKTEEIERAKALCGYYILKTTEKDSKPEVIEEKYKRLKEVEKVFRDLKEHLSIRPIYHWKDRRVQTHIFLCLLSQVVLSHTRKRLKEAGWLGTTKDNTLENFIRKLAAIKVGKFKISDKIVYQVQKKNNLKDLLLLAFKIKPFNFYKDKENCSI